MSRRVVALIAAAATLVAGVAAIRFAPTAETRLLFTGDILLARQVAVEIERTGGSPWDSLASVFSRADFVAGNFEGAIGADSACGAGNQLCFATPASAARMLSAAKFRAVSVENNHAGDLGAAGRRETIDALRDAGVLALDFEHSPRFVRVGDMTMAMIAVSTVAAADGQLQRIPSTELAQKLRLARALANVVVVSVHWGAELQDWPNETQRLAAAWLVDHGADLVVGHHPHVVQDPDCVHGRPVYFSLGNHVFDQKYPQTKDGLIADCTIRGGRLRCGGLRTHARRGSATPVLDGDAGLRTLAACEPKVGSPAPIAGYWIRPQPWSASNDSDGVVLEGWRDGAAQWRTRRARLVTLEQARFDSTVSLVTLERHPSDMDGEVALRPHVYGVSDRGLVAKWRGTSLAWPLLDAVIDSGGTLCALHRGDSFVRPDRNTATTRTMRYRWNGFGFSASSGTTCDAVFR